MGSIAIATTAGDVGQWLLTGLRILVAGFGLLLATGTALSLTRLPHWPARMWDFPRVQIAFLAPLCALIVMLLGLPSRPHWWEWAFLAIMLTTTAIEAVAIWPYTPLASEQVKRSGKTPPPTRNDPNVVRLVISNVLQQNRQFARWREVIGDAEPDIVIAAETDTQWIKEIDHLLADSHPHRVVRPQDNMYGMGLWSRLPLEETRIEFIVQDDIPSIHTCLRLKDGSAVMLHCLHPRPPAPQEGDSSAPRDAELVIMGRRVREENKAGRRIPSLIVGDLNDVAWSRTTTLFCRLSGLLDPRRGRGFYNTFNANSRWLRFPLDHVFLSREFRLLELRILDHVGSDHFPVCITLSLEPERAEAQHEPELTEDEREEARETIETQIEREQDGDEDGHLTQSTRARSE